MKYKEEGARTEKEEAYPKIAKRANPSYKLGEV